MVATVQAWVALVPPWFLEYARLFRQGFFITVLVSSNTYQVAHSHILGAGGIGFMISLIWFYNAQKAAKSTQEWAPYVYALGAGVGTMTGTALMTILWGGN